MRVNPKFAMARATAPMFSGFRGDTSTTLMRSRCDSVSKERL
jgi:hypothetical protein